MKSLLKLAMTLVLLTSILKAQDTRLDGYLRSGKLQDGLSAFAKPADDGERFSLAVLQTLQGFQQFAEGTTKLGIKQSLGRSLPFFRMLPAQPAGQATEVATPEKVRALFTNLRESLKKANATLAKVGDTGFKVQVNLTRAHLSTKDGAPAMPLTDSLSRIVGLGAASEQDIVVNFDSADAVWLKGYTHLLTGMLEVFMSYDWGPVWNQMSYLLFTSPNPMPPMAKYAVSGQGQGGPTDWADLIAAVHDLRLEVKDAEGLKRALVEFRSMIACSRLCWTRIQAETDDDLEWLPSAKKKGSARCNRFAGRDRRLGHCPRRARRHPRRQKAPPALAHHQRHGHQCRPARPDSAQARPRADGARFRLRSVHRGRRREQQYPLAAVDGTLRPGRFHGFCPLEQLTSPRQPLSPEPATLFAGFSLPRLPTIFYRKVKVLRSEPI